MEQDEKGFWYPSIDEGKCTDCGQCILHCPVIQETMYHQPIEVYAMKIKKETERMESQSGGAFYALAKHFILMGGEVCGATMTKEFRVLHQIASTMEGVANMRRSKYVQSDMQDMYLQVLERLQKGIPILFSGTPCQIAGIRQTVKDHPQKELLTCVDIVCHGIPSPVVWHQMMQVYEKVYGGSMQSFSFRDKAYGWHSHKETISIAKETHCISQFTDLFYRHLMMNDCCETCGYSSLKRVGDITIGDYWGIEQKYANFDDNKGVSLVLINTEKGKALFQAIDDDCVKIETTLEDAMQRPLKEPYHKSVFAPCFWYSFFHEGVEKAYQRYGKGSSSQIVCKNIMQIIKVYLHGV